MNIDRLNSTPAEFIRLHSNAYNIRSVTKEGVSYYKSYHYEQIRDFFVLEYHLRQGNLPNRIPGGYDAFCQAFERDVKCKKLTKVSFATIDYDGPDPTSILVNGDSRSPTVQDVLGPDADLRSQWEKKGVRRMTDEDDEVLHQIALKHMSDRLRIDHLKKMAFDECEDKCSRKGLCTPDPEAPTLLPNGKNYLATVVALPLALIALRHLPLNLCTNLPLWTKAGMPT